MVKVAALIFDLDGTLVDSAEDIALSLNHMLQQLSMNTLEMDSVRGFIGDGMHTLIARATRSTDKDFLKRAVAIFREHYSEHCCDHARLYPGTDKALTFFSEKKKAVVTNKPGVMTRQILRHLDMDRHFQSVCSAESTQNRKPHPEPVLKVLAELAVAPDQAIFIGDGTTDIQAGSSAGVKTCAVTYGYRTRQELENCNPDFIIDRLDQLTKIVS